MADDNVILTGFMGTGKTTVGRLLAARLGYDRIDTDTMIESRWGPIPEIFRMRGADAFRRLERAVAYELAQRQRLVISTGGRLMLDFGNAYHLGRTGRVFCLVASPERILERIAADADQRPLLAGDNPAGRIAELLRARSAGYARFEQVDTTERTPGDVADEIVARLAV